MSKIQMEQIHQKMPRSTYRIQLRKEFKFHDVVRISGYLEELGISHIYLSPILEARAESSHGYDVLDPTRLSEERGGEAGFKKLVQKLEKSKSLEGLILDIVPNHVGAHFLNPYWWDVLKRGESSAYWNFFDIRPRSNGSLKVVLPVLGRHRRSLVAARELKLEAKNNEFVVRYWDNIFPVNDESFARLSALLGKKPKPKVLKDINAQLAQLPLKVITAVLEEQHYQLMEWRKGSREINYRRFFDINDLAAIKVEDPKVFEWSHSKIIELLRSYPLISGLRVDHIDGLAEPAAYLKRLSKVCSRIWVEKILGDGENLSPEWPILGSTGYEFSNQSARLFVLLSGVLHLHSHYVRHIDGRWERFHDCVYDSKREILESYFVSELTYLSQQLFEYYQSHEPSDEKVSLFDLREGLIELTCSLKVYRTYHKGHEDFIDPWLSQAFTEVEGRGQLFSKAATEWLKKFLTSPTTDSKTTLLIKRWEQLTGPVMAKGLEDTALYRYFPLLSLNVVGGEPDWVGDGTLEFHAANQERLRNNPFTLNTTSTHDSKRSEDVRSRIHVLSEVCEEWIKFFEKWYQKNHSGKANKRPDPHTEYLIYETLIGAWPIDGKPNSEFIKRMNAYFVKASREAKSETSWIEPNADFENTLTSYVEGLIKAQSKTQKEFLKALGKITDICAYFGAFNSLSLLTLKALSPGIPDFYQGAELWDLSLVDPDNRRKVDFALREKLLKNLKHQDKKSSKQLMSRLLKRWKSGEIKLWLTWKLLDLRKRFPELFSVGQYYALEPQGENNHNFIAFLREHNGRWALVAVPKLLARSTKLQTTLKIENRTLLEARFSLPQQVPETWVQILTGKKLNGRDFTVEEVFDGAPVGVLISP